MKINASEPVVLASPAILSQAVRELVASVPRGHQANLFAKLTNPAKQLSDVVRAVLPEKTGVVSK